MVGEVQRPTAKVQGQKSGEAWDNLQGASPTSKIILSAAPLQTLKQDKYAYPYASISSATRRIHWIKRRSSPWNLSHTKGYLSSRGSIRSGSSS